MISVQQFKIDMNVSIITCLLAQKSMIYKSLLTQITKHKQFTKLKVEKIKSFNLLIEHKNCFSLFDLYSNNNWTKDFMGI